MKDLNNDPKKPNVYNIKRALNDYLSNNENILSHYAFFFSAKSISTYADYK